MDIEPVKVGNYEYRSNALIGQGSFGKVYLGHSLDNHRPVAIKCFAKEKLRKKSLFKSLKNEVETLKRIKHEHVVQFHEIVIGEKEIYMIMEYCNQKDLKSYIRGVKIVPEETAVNFLRQVLSAFKELCRKHIIHRDLKPANLLLHDGKLKIADFGFARFIEDDVTNYDKVLVSIVGTPLYMSPQLLAKERYTTKSDIWSIGIIFYEMCFGKVPWVAKDPQSYLKNILSIPPPIDRKINNISIEAEDFIVHCLRVTESERMGWQEMFNHPLVKPKVEQKTEETATEFSNDEGTLESKLKGYSTKTVITPSRLIMSGYDDNANPSIKINHLKIQEFTPAKLLGSRLSYSHAYFNEAKFLSVQHSKNKVQIQQMPTTNNLPQVKNFKVNNVDETRKGTNSSFQEEGFPNILANIDSEFRNPGNGNTGKLTGDLPNVNQGGNDEDVINGPSSRLNFMSLDFKYTTDEVKDFDKVLLNCRAIELKIWEFLTVLEENSHFYRINIGDKYKISLLLVKLLSIFIEGCVTAFKKIIFQNSYKILEETSKSKKIAKILELLEQDSTVIKDMEAHVRRNFLSLGSDSQLDDKDKDALLKFFTKFSHSTNCKEIENELTKLLAKVCIPFKDLISKKKLDLMLKNTKKKQCLAFFHCLSIFFQGQMFDYITSWRPESKFDLDEQDLKADAFDENIILEMFRESYLKVMKYLESTSI